MVAALVTLGVACWDGFDVGVAAAVLSDVLGIAGPVLAVALSLAFWLIYRAGFQQWNGAVGVTGLLALAVGSWR
jgi:hypothetical protein